MPQIEQRWLFGPRRSAADSGADSADRCTSFWDGRSGWFTVCGLNAMVVAVSSVLLVSMLLSFCLLHRRTRYAAGQDEDDDGDGGGGGGGNGIDDDDPYDGMFDRAYTTNNSGRRGKQQRQRRQVSSPALIHFLLALFEDTLYHPMRADVRHIADVVPSRRRRSGPFRNRGRSSSELSSISDILGGNSIGNEEGHALLPPAYVLGSLPRGAPFAVDYKATALWQVQEGAKLMLCCGNYRSPIRMFLDHVAVALRQHSM